MARPRQVSDEEIDGAARATFLAHGGGAPVALVAKALQVSQAALFHRVKSKEGLLLRALRPRVPGVVQALMAGPRPGALYDQLVPMLGDLLAHLEEVIPCLIVLRSAGLSPGAGAGEPPTVVLRRALAEWLTLAAAASQTTVSRPAAIAEGLLGALEARAFNRYLGGTAFAPGDDGAFLHALVAGLVPEPAPAEPRVSSRSTMKRSRR